MFYVSNPEEFSVFYTEPGNEPSYVCSFDTEELALAFCDGEPEFSVTHGKFFDLL